MTIVELMADHRHRQVYGHDTPLPEDSDLVTILGNAMMCLARANPENCTPEVTQALAIFHVWEASRK